jgi:phosphopantothenoylcysteine decarboxylase / phosphopantothenate---cysteine ligase
MVAAPAMNPRMWSAPATAESLELLAARGVELVGPGEGDTAEGEVGVGRMAEPEEIAAAVEARLRAGRSLAGVRVLVTAGGTREPLDAVRFLGNRSSGRMGVALAQEARRRGADVTLLAANLAVAPPKGVAVVETPTADAMLDAALAHADADVVLMAAAVADYRPSERRAEKRPKNGAPWALTLEPTEDILARLASNRRTGQILVGFAADHGEMGIARAREKLARKRVDFVVFNDVGRDDIGFDAADNEVVIIEAGGEQPLAKDSKDRIAAAIVERAEELLRERS